MSGLLTSILIPVLVTGIQPTCVCTAREPFQPNGLGWLDSRDKHRNEGGDDQRRWLKSSYALCQNQPSHRVS